MKSLKDLSKELACTKDPAMREALISQMKAMESDLVDTISTTVKLRRRGDIYEGFCPWCDSTEPTLTVNPNTEVYLCTSCNKTGDKIKWVVENGFTTGFYIDYSKMNYYKRKTT